MSGESVLNLPPIFDCSIATWQDVHLEQLGVTGMCKAFVPDYVRHGERVIVDTTPQFPGDHAHDVYALSCAEADRIRMMQAYRDENGDVALNDIVHQPLVVESVDDTPRDTDCSDSDFGECAPKVCTRFTPTC